MPIKQPKFAPERFTAGSTILHEGDSPDKFYVIIKGEVDIIQSEPKNVINQLGPRQFFGEIGMLQTSQRTASAHARTDVKLMAMDQAAFRSWISSSSQIQTKIEQALTQRVEADQAASPQPDEDISGTEIYTANELIIEQGTLADQFFIILDGSVEVVYVEENGRDHIIAQLDSGDFFGEIGLLQNVPRMTSVRAQTDVQLISFDQDEFITWMAYFPSGQHGIQQTAHQRFRETSELVGKLQS